MQSHARALVKHINTICRDFVEDRVDGYEVLFVHVNLATVNFKTLWGPNDSKVNLSLRDSRICNHVFHLKILEIYWGRQELIAYKQLCILLKGGALESNVIVMPAHRLGFAIRAWGL